MSALQTLQQLFKRFPGIGERQAMRFAYFIASTNPGFVDELIQGIQKVRSSVRRCGMCFGLQEEITDGICVLCRDPEKDSSLLLIVEKEADKERIVASHTYKGRYFVLGGLAPVIDTGKSYMRIAELVDRIKKDTALGEIILALSATPDGERTVQHIQKHVRPLLGTKKLTVLGRGLSTGTEIEYSDPQTIESALEGRVSV